MLQAMVSYFTPKAKDLKLSGTMVRFIYKRNHFRDEVAVGLEWELEVESGVMVQRSLVKWGQRRWDS